MSGFTENRASGASERFGGDPVVLTWGAAEAMLPLVGRIAADMVQLHDRLARLRPEKNRLDRMRRTLAWPDRARRYELQEETAAVLRDLQDASAELDVLGVALLNGPTGMVGFPTMVNDRPAYFSWRPGEETLAFWNYADDLVRRPVPAAWTRPPVKERERRKQGKTGPQR
ncbi:MAG TPA: DUF2203 family protein [Gemmataceae bacterium]|nr:DUF2203 family protein [Gemmataceae bacterium]